MRFKDYYFKRFIGGMPPHQFEQILEDQSPELTARVLENGSIYLSNHKIIKCVCNYYRRTDDKEFPKVSQNNAFLMCHVARTEFGLSNIVGKMNCKYCHKTCLEKIRNGELKRK